MEKGNVFLMVWLNLTANEIGDEGARLISECLKCNTALTKLCLYGKCWKKARERRGSHASWGWRDNRIGDEGVRAISDLLKNNTTLVELNLPCDEVISSGLEEAPIKMKVYSKPSHRWRSKIIKRSNEKQ